MQSGFKASGAKSCQSDASGFNLTQHGFRASEANSCQSDAKWFQSDPTWFQSLRGCEAVVIWMQNSFNQTQHGFIKIKMKKLCLTSCFETVNISSVELLLRHNK